MKQENHPRRGNKKRAFASQASRDSFKIPRNKKLVDRNLNCEIIGNREFSSKSHVSLICLETQEGTPQLALA